jgi:FdhD protein
MLEVEVTRLDVSTGRAEKMTDSIAEEKPLHLFLNRTRYATIFCSPSDLKELALGYALSEGIIKGLNEVDKISFGEENEVCRLTLKGDVDIDERLKLINHLSRVILSACGGKSSYQSFPKLSKIKSDLKVKPDILLNCVNRLNSIAGTFRKTGGVHVAAIYGGDGSLVSFAEDVGRHNAVDKAIGKAALDNIDFSECFLALSGRLTGDIVLKAARVGLSIVASLAAAIDSGIALAKSAGLTLVGFVRGKRMNIYNLPERILS